MPHNDNITTEFVPLCGKPRRYFPQQTCGLVLGHSGDHEDDTHIWEGSA